MSKSAAKRDGAGHEPVYAAGVVVWHESRKDGAKDPKRRILIVHRDRHDDWSLPKGKVDPGETLFETAIRELEEETGIRALVGQPLGKIEYDLPSGRPKEVHYWLGEHPGPVDETAFEANDEVDEIRWVTTSKAREMLTYERDRDLLDKVDEIFAAGTARTRPIIIQRHGKAEPPHNWDGDDASRPLTSRGREQATQMAGILRYYAPEQLITSPATRCRQTIEPHAEHIGQEPAIEDRISQDAHSSGESLDSVAADILNTRSRMIVCSHSPVIPDLVEAICHATGDQAALPARNAMLSTGECIVLHVATIDAHADRIVAVSHHGPTV